MLGSLRQLDLSARWAAASSWRSRLGSRRLECQGCSFGSQAGCAHRPVAPCLPAAAKIDGRRYNNPLEFRDDVRLTFNNCRIFNPPGEAAAAAAGRLL